MSENSQPEVVEFDRKFRMLRLPNLKSIKKHKKPFSIALLVIIVALTIIFGSKFYKNYRPALIIGNEKISQKEYNNLLAQARVEGINPAKIKSTVIESKKAQQAAKKVGMDINDSEIILSLMYNGLKVNSTNLNEWNRLVGSVGAINTAKLNNKEEGYEGYVFIFPYSRYFLGSDLEHKDAKFYDEKAIEEDRLYAIDKANEYRNKLQAKQIGPEEIVNEIKKDHDRLEFGNAGNSSGFFSVNKLGLTNISSVTTRNVAGKYIGELNSLTEGGISKLITEKQLQITKDGKKVSRDAAYYFIYKTKNKTANPNIEKDFQEVINNLKVTDNVK